MCGSGGHGEEGREREGRVGGRKGKMEGERDGRGTEREGGEGMDVKGEERKGEDR